MKRRKISLSLIFLLLVSFIGIMYTLLNRPEKMYTSTTMMMTIEEKEHYIEPGKYQKMWVMGTNANDPDKNKERFKVMIGDSRIYNLLEEGKEYFVTFQGVKKNEESEYIFTFSQIGNPEGTQMSGDGIIEE
ncbi:hypothetical protein DYI25_06100 [Mesobacillus boroniphilus]|uniref:Uncharacterized protein n=1 Tax=Mesobacillus boroniphilus TaxID=308892 RepID=A0A944CJM6_9BACI|nr:hypothetical protein [Mesobacillus boroniphilus]MBS8264004.1 hypothetical protein [Mesobacillus boroniphilus]